MNDQALYIKKTNNTNLERAFTKVAYHAQQARKHLDAISTQSLADELGITKQGLQLRIKVHEREVEK